MSKAAECSLLSHNERDINTWRYWRPQMMWKQTGFKQKPGFLLNWSRCPHSGVTELPSTRSQGRPFGSCSTKSSKPKSHRQDCALSVSAAATPLCQLTVSTGLGCVVWAVDAEWVGLFPKAII